MHPHIAEDLALLLFLPWYAIPGALFRIHARQPCAGSGDCSMPPPWRSQSRPLQHAHRTMAAADTREHPICNRVLASTLSCGLSLLVMVAALRVQRRLSRRAAAGMPRVDRHG